MSPIKATEEQAARIRQPCRRDTPTTTNRDVPRFVPQSSLSLMAGQYYADVDPFCSSRPLEFSTVEAPNSRAIPRHKQLDILHTNEAVTANYELAIATLDDMASSTKATKLTEALSESSASHRAEAESDTTETQSATIKPQQAFSENGHDDVRETHTAEPSSESRTQTIAQAMDEAVIRRTVRGPPRSATREHTVSCTLPRKSKGSRHEPDYATAMFAREFARLALIESTFRSKAADQAQVGPSDRPSSDVNTRPKRSSDLKKL